MIMGVDIAAGGNDDTALSVFEHYGQERLLRFHTTLSEQDLNAVGISGKPRNPSDMASYVSIVADNMGVDKVYIDKTGVGEGFNNELTKVLGRRAEGFDFDDKGEIARMMGDFNYALHNDLLTLLPGDGDIIGKQLKAIVKEKSHRTSKPKFSGKENAPNGKDDLAMALVLAAYPPNFDADRNIKPETRKNVSEYESDDEKEVEGSENGVFKQLMNAGSASGRSGMEKSDSNDLSAFGTPDTGNNRRYKRRHSR